MKSYLLPLKKYTPQIYRLLRYTFHRSKVAVLTLVGRCDLLRKIEGKRNLKRAYKKLHGRNLNLRNPTTFSEKLFNRMISVNELGNSQFTRLSDKFLVRNYVRERIGEEHLVGLIWHGQDPRQIPFESLPSKCVIKTNHGSGGNIIINGPYDKTVIIRKLTRWMSENFYAQAHEYHYYPIVPCILIEEFIYDGQDSGPLDYRFFCFNGQPELIQVDNYAHNINPFYDKKWNKTDLNYRKNFKNVDIRKPESFDEMLYIARKLSDGFDFVRVDLYNSYGKTFFGEMTFTPMAGRFRFNPEHWDAVLGEKWDGETTHV